MTVRRLVALIVLAFALGTLGDNLLGSPCNMRWDNGAALDAEDCAYMGGGGWDD